MNANLMMLLPLLLAKNVNGKKTNEGGIGISPDVIMNLFSASGGASGGGSGMNPMAAMLMSMTGKNKQRTQSETTARETHEESNEPTDKPAPEKIFDKDVLNMLKIFIDLKNAEKG